MEKVYTCISCNKEEICGSLEGWGWVSEKAICCGECMKEAEKTPLSKRLWEVLKTSPDPVEVLSGLFADWTDDEEVGIVGNEYAENVLNAISAYLRQYEQVAVKPGIKERADIYKWRLINRIKSLGLPLRSIDKSIVKRKISGRLFKLFCTIGLARQNIVLVSSDEPSIGVAITSIVSGKYGKPTWWNRVIITLEVDQNWGNEVLVVPIYSHICLKKDVSLHAHGSVIVGNKTTRCAIHFLMGPEQCTLDFGV